MGGEGIEGDVQKNIHLGKNSSIIVNITLNILSLSILRQSISHERLSFVFLLQISLPEPRKKKKNLPTLTFSVCISRIFFFPGPEVSKRVLDPELENM